MKLKSPTLILSVFLFNAFFLHFNQGVSSETEVFSEIYRNKTWGSNDDGSGSSGGGSALHTTVAYREFLQDFLADYDIQSVVDLGCGDWEFSRAMDWSGIDYCGLDVVAEVINRNLRKYKAPNINFMKTNVFAPDLPEADLLICKDVLQHLSNADIMAIIPQFSKFKYCLITNDYDTSNYQIPSGHWRGLDLSKPPFSLKGVSIFRYQADLRVKEVFLICQEDL